MYIYTLLLFFIFVYLTVIIQNITFCCLVGNFRWHGKTWTQTHRWTSFLLQPVFGDIHTSAVPARTSEYPPGAASLQMCLLRLVIPWLCVLPSSCQQAQSDWGEATSSTDPCGSHAWCEWVFLCMWVGGCMCIHVLCACACLCVSAHLCEHAYMYGCMGLGVDVSNDRATWNSFF